MALVSSVCMILSSPVCPPDSSKMVTGWLSQYGESPTIATIEYRQMIGDLPVDLTPFDGFIAVANCGRIGDTGWLSINGGPLERIAVFDCSGHIETTTWMSANQIIAEVSYRLAVKYGLINQGGIEGLLYWEEDVSRYDQ